MIVYMCEQSYLSLNYALSHNVPRLQEYICIGLYVLFVNVKCDLFCNQKVFIFSTFALSISVYLYVYVQDWEGSL